MSTLEVNKITPAGAATEVTLGDSGDTFTIPSGATIANSGTATGFGLTNWSESSGNLLASNASYGIYLGVNSATDSNLLHDYEEGTWTPALSNMTVSGSFSSSGRYVKVGRMVLCYGKFSAATSIAFDSSGLLSGLPFAGAVTDQGTIAYERRTYNGAAGGIGIGDFSSSRFFFKDSFATTSSNQETTFTIVYEANS
jgi:hypothetical protein|tara:strand:+ start:156 stop:746 length:591 start_codon:yes stop_codon:yes gene_type:complete